MQRKRPLPAPPARPAIGGNGSKGPSRKKQKLTPAKPLPLPVDAYARLARAATPGPPPPPPPQQRTPVNRGERTEERRARAERSSLPSPAPASPSPADDAERDSVALSLHDRDGEEEDGSEEAPVVAQMPSLVLMGAAASRASVTPSPSFSASPSPVSSARPSSASLPLQHLHFLLSSAHSLALVSPSTSQHLVRLLRALSAQFAIDFGDDVRSHFCSHCNAVLLPGLTCTRRSAVDHQRTLRWTKKQQKKRAKREKHRTQPSLPPSSSSSSLSETPLQPPNSHASDGVLQQPVVATPRLRLNSAQRKADEKACRRAQREAAIQPVRFFHSIVQCGQCGQENGVEGSQVKKGGRHCPDLRVISAGQSGAQTKRKSRTRGEPQKTQPRSEVSTPADEEKKAARRRHQLQRQQAMATTSSERGAAGSGEAPTSSTSDAFTGSLFFRFQKPVRRTLRLAPHRIASTAASHAKRRCSTSFSICAAFLLCRASKAS